MRTRMEIHVRERNSIRLPRTHTRMRAPLPVHTDARTRMHVANVVGGTVRSASTPQRERSAMSARCAPPFSGATNE